MKIGINTVTFLGEKPEKRLELSRQAGFEGVEILAYPEELSTGRRGKMKRLLKRLDLEAMMIATGPPMAMGGGRLCLESPDRAVRERTVQYVKDCVDWANDFESDNIYVVTPTSRSEIQDLGKAVECLRDSLTQVCDYARSSGVKICIEHSPGKLVGEASYLNQTVREFNIENLGSLIDVGHLNMTKEDVVNTVMETDKLYHVHFDNNDGKNDIHTPLDVGTLPRREVVKFVKALKQKKYDGYYSIELLNLQNPIKTLKENIEFLREIYESV
ncbi:MAG: sugar phosphate isomerase/epimerase family protein [Candidatus Bathyarchaeia archaeon]